MEEKTNSQIKDFASSYVRVLAWLIDLFIITFLFQLFASPVTASTTFVDMLDSLLGFILVILILFSLILPLVYVFMINLLGATPGKLLSGISVEDENGIRLSFWKAFLRNYLGYAVSASFIWLGYIWVFVDSKRQAWHDMVAGSFVVVNKKYGWMSGIFAFIVLLAANIYVFSSLYKNILQNISIYEQIINNLK